MTKLVWASLPVVAALGVWGGFARQNTDRELKVVSGKATMGFFSSILETKGIKVETRNTIEGNLASAEKSVGYKIGKTNLKFTLQDGAVGRFDSGYIELIGGLSLTTKAGKVSTSELVVKPLKSVNDGLQVLSGKGTDSFVLFDLAHPRKHFEIKDLVLSFAEMDMLISVPCAQRLGRPELAGTLVGTFSVFADTETVDGGTLSEAPPAPAPIQGPIDVAISDMSSLTYLGRTGTYPNGRNGFSMLTTSCNVGTQNIPWQAPMQVAHPVIAMNLYRMKDGKFEQVGWSWLKHGFLATNSPGCGTCQNPGTGSLLGPGCSDTYGVGNNSDRRYLGGRDEVNPFTGVWTCTGSWFSNYQNDCVRRNTSMSDEVSHRLDVADADLANAGATYVYEAYYINTNETTDKYNNVASRRANITRPNSSWVIQELDSQQTQGPAINRWGDMRATATPRTEGDVIVAAKVTDLGGGMYRYDYALYNHDLDRQVREFSVPVPNGSVVQNFEFRDIDADGSNQWSSSFADNKVSWSTGTFGSSTANPLKYSSVFNFRFDTNVPPSSGPVKLGLFKPGTSSELTASVKAPLFLQTPQEFSPMGGTTVSGSLESLSASDDDRMVLAPSSVGVRSGTGVTGSTTLSSPTASVLTIGVEARNTLSNGATGVQKIWLWNWSTSSWEQVDSRPTTTSDSKVIVSITSNAARFINSQDNKVMFRTTHIVNPGATARFWRVEIDQLGVQAG